MTTTDHETNGFMFAEKDVCHPPYKYGGWWETWQTSFPRTFTTVKPDVSRVRRYGKNGELGKLTNIPQRNFRMIGKGVRR